MSIVLTPLTVSLTQPLSRELLGHESNRADEDRAPEPLYRELVLPLHRGDAALPLRETSDAD